MTVIVVFFNATCRYANGFSFCSVVRHSFETKFALKEEKLKQKKILNLYEIKLMLINKPLKRKATAKKFFFLLV